MPQGTHAAAKGEGPSQTLSRTKRGSQGPARLGMHAWVGRRMTWGRGRRPHWRSHFLPFWVRHLPKNGAQSCDQFHLTAISRGFGHRSSGGAEICPFCRAAAPLHSFWGLLGLLCQSTLYPPGSRSSTPPLEQCLISRAIFLLLVTSPPHPRGPNATHRSFLMEERKHHVFKNCQTAIH